MKSGPLSLSKVIAQGLATKRNKTKYIRQLFAKGFARKGMIRLL
jgi:hypothetical protein